ncbi:hypothetical protein [Phenylobacterium sp.]
MIDVDAILMGAIVALTLFLVGLGIVAGVRRLRRPRGAPYGADMRTHRR